MKLVGSRRTYPLERVKWVTVNYLLKSDDGPRDLFEWEYQIVLPHFLARWDVWDYWERERIHSMRDHLKQGDVLYDVGAENGWCSMVYAQLVGCENMVLIEPGRDFWPNIKATWEHNCADMPLACFNGLISDKSTYGDATASWPKAAFEGDLISTNNYAYLHVQPELPQKTIDHLAGAVGNPNALTIDCEGAELVILRGAVDVLSFARPLVWVSVHPDLAERDYGTTTSDLLQFADDLEYDWEILAVDHETHMLLTPR